MKVSIDNIVKEMPKDLTEIEKVRYLYIEIGKISSFNVEYACSLDDGFCRYLYNEKMSIMELERQNYQNKVQVLCKQESELLAEILNKIGIKSEIVGIDKDILGHVDAVVTIGDKKYCLDLVTDTYNIQKGLKTKKFATTEKLFNGMKCDTINEEELRKIDIKLGYCKSGIYTDEIIEMLKVEMTNPETMERYMISRNPSLKDKKITKDMIFKYKVDFIYKFIRNNMAEEDKLEIMELRDYYKYIFKNILTPEERSKMKRYFFSYKENRQLKYSMVSEVKYESGKTYYIYKDEDRGFSEISGDELKKLSSSISYFNEGPELEK